MKTSLFPHFHEYQMQMQFSPPLLPPLPDETARPGKGGSPAAAAVCRSQRVHTAPQREDLSERSLGNVCPPLPEVWQTQWANMSVRNKLAPPKMFWITFQCLHGLHSADNMYAPRRGVLSAG